MLSRICSSQEEFETVSSSLKTTACPHCKRVGHLIRHGFLRGYDDKHQRQRTVRAWRIFCSNRHRAGGCGRTFSVWMAEKVKRLFLTADSLWEFLKQAVTSNNKWQAFRRLNSGLTDSAPYRIWKRFQNAESAIRTALTPLTKPPRIVSEQPAERTLAHLQQAFEQHPLSPIAAFQVTLQVFFM